MTLVRCRRRLLRHQRRLVSERLDDVQHALGGRGCDTVSAVDDLGHGRNGDAGGARHIADRRPPGR